MVSEVFVIALIIMSSVLLTLTAVTLGFVKAKFDEHRSLVNETKLILEHFKKVASEAEVAHNSWVKECQGLKDKVTAMSMTIRKV